MSDIKDKLIIALLTAIAKPAFDVLIQVGKLGINKVVKFPRMVQDFVKWWAGKTIAIIGAPASGKNSFYD